MFKVIARLTVDQQQKSNRKTPPREFQSQIRRTPPRDSEITRISPPKVDEDELARNQSPISQTPSQLKIKKSSEESISKTIISNSFMVIALFCYAAFGALTFQMLEQHEELRKCEEGMGKYKTELREYANLIMRYVQFNLTDQGAIDSSFENQFGNNETLNGGTSFMSKAGFVFDEVVTENYVDTYLNEFKNKLLEISSDTGFRGQNCLEKSKWKFSSSLLFVITCISSIGYGFISPVTWEGQLVCICYTFIGIPFFLMTLTKLSINFGHMFTFLYLKLAELNPLTSYLAKRKLQKKLKKANMLPSSKSATSNFKLILSQHDIVSLTHSDLDQAIHVLDELDYQNAEFDEDSDDDDNEEDKLEEVPLILSFISIVAFFYFSTYFFHKTNDWAMPSSLYFVFISLTSLGFGDLVPGTDLDDKNSDFKLLFCSGYCLVGMAFMGTCVNLMFKGIKRKLMQLIKWLKKVWSTISCRKPTLEDQRREQLEMLSRIKQLRYYFDDEEDQDTVTRDQQ